MDYTERLAQDYSKSREQYNETDDRLFTILSEIGIRDRTVLDVGCGDGRHAKWIVDHEAKSVTAIDPSIEMIRLAKTRYKDLQIDFFVAGAERIPLFNSSQDLVFSNFALHHCENLSKAFVEINRVLKQGGCCVAIFNVSTLAGGFEHLANTEMLIRLGKDVVVHDRIKTRGEVSAAIDESGLKLIREEELSHPNAVIDENYTYKDKVNKHAMLFVLRKPFEPLKRA